MEIKHLEVLVMDNGEVLCLGKSLGQVREFERALRDLPKEKAQEEKSE